MSFGKLYSYAVSRCLSPRGAVLFMMHPRKRCWTPSLDEMTNHAVQGNPRTVGALVVAKENKLDLQLVETRPADGVSTDYKLMNKLGKIPTFEGADGFVLSETIAINVYRTSLVARSSPSLPPAHSSCMMSCIIFN